MSEEDTKKRIINDYQILITNDELLQSSGIYYQFDDENIYHMTAMIIGPEKTPYHGGFYLFDITFPKEYPNLPPKFVYHTNYRDIRFNPNLYTNGNVCLSLLNTWSGTTQDEGWTPSNNIMSVLISIQGMVLNEFPLINEPGHDHVGDDHRDYNKVLIHENFYTAVCRMMEFTPKGFETYTPIMKKHFLKNIKWYLSTVEDLHKKHKKTKVFQCYYSSNKTHNEYDITYKKMVKLATKYSPEFPDILVELPSETIVEAPVAVEAAKKIPQVTKKVAKKKSDSDSESESDDNMPTLDGKCKGLKNNGEKCSFVAKGNGYCKVHAYQAKK